MRSIVNYRNSGGVFLAAKPEERDEIRQLFKEVGRENDLIEFSLDSEDRCNFLDCIANTGGGPREVSRFLSILSESLQNGDGKGGESHKFFETQRNRGIECGTIIVQSAYGKVTVELLQRFFSNMAQSAEQVNDPNWKKGFHGETIRQAIANAKARRDQYDVAIAVEYFLLEMPNLDGRTRSNITTDIAGLLHILSSGIVRELCSGKTTFTPDDTFKRRWVLCNAPPSRFGDGGKVVNVGLKYLLQRAVLARHAQPDDAIVGIWGDEFQGVVNSFDAHYLAQARSHLGFMVCIAQGMPSYYSALRQAGKHQAEELMSNFSSVILHACDPVTAAWGVSKIGKSLQTFIGGSMAPQADVYDELFGNTKFTGSFSEHYEEILQPNCLMNGLRTGGPANQWLVDSIVLRSGELFSNGNCWLWKTWRQK